MPRWDVVIHKVLRLLASGLLLSALLGVTQPVIVCQCGAETPHTHSAWGFDPHHHHHAVDVVSGRDVSPDDEVALTAGDERLSAQALVACIDSAHRELAQFRALSPRPSCLSWAQGRSDPPDPPPPRGLV